MGADMKDEGGERIVHREGAGKKESDAGRGHYELVSPLFMRRLAIWLEKGAKKYDTRNWEKGIPQGRIIRALLRHTYQYLEGMRDEDHLAAISCNIMFLIHFEVGIERGLYSSKDVKAMCDLPNYLEKLKDKLAEALDESVIKQGFQKYLSKEERLQDASKHYYEAKAKLDTLEMERITELAKPLTGKTEPIFVCQFQTCNTIIATGKTWCLAHHPQVEKICEHLGCAIGIPNDQTLCNEHQVF